MKKIYTIALLGLTVIAVSSCGFLDGEELYIPDALEGTWIWQRSTGGFIGEIIDADSVNYTRRLVIHENARANIYKNEELVRTYTIKFEDHEWLEKPTYVFYSDDGSMIVQFIAELDDNRLVLMDNCADCYIHYFIRK